MTQQPLEIRSANYWYKIIEMLQQNWALIEPAPTGKSCTVFFLGDTSGVFDRMSFATVAEAKAALRRNGFARFAENKRVQKFIYPPQPPFHETSHPNGPIYSSGRYWVSTTNKRLIMNKKTIAALAPLVQKRREPKWENYTRHYKCIGDYHAGKYECDYVSPYTKSASNANSNVMVILQDWASDIYLAGPFDQNLDTFGRDPTVLTNINLENLLGTHFKLAIGQIYATNLFPFVKLGRMNAPIPKKDLVNAAKEFCIGELDIIQPKLAICLGHACFGALSSALGKPRHPNIASAIATPFKHRSTTVYCQAHTSQQGQNNRNRKDPEQVKNDWEKMHSWFLGHGA